MRFSPPANRARNTRPQPTLHAGGMFGDCARKFWNLSARQVVLLLALLTVFNTPVFGGIAPGGRQLTPKLYVLAIGVGDFSSNAASLLRLAYPASDAARVSQAFLSLTPRAVIVENKVMVDRAATREAVLSAARAAIGALEEEDVLVIYWAGHSISSPLDGDIYLVPTDADLAEFANQSRANAPQNNVESQGASELRRNSLISIRHDLAPLAGERRKVLLLADGCNIGEGQLGDTGLRYPGFTIISASKRDEVSFEGHEWGGSPFAEQIVMTLRQHIPDLDGDGLISAEEFHMSVYPRVLSATRRRGLSRQHPAISGGLSHRVMLSQAPEAIQEFVAEGPILLAGAATGRLTVNGREIRLSADPDRNTITLGSDDQSIFRPGLNLVQSITSRYLYWREENRLVAFQSPYRKSYAILVAIDDYDRITDSRARGRTGYRQLERMVDRSKELRNALIGVGFPAVNIIELYDADATSEKFQATLREFYAGGSYADADRLFVYFGGHGEAYDRGVRLVTFDYERTRPSLTTFDARDLVESHSRHILARHVLFALDVCHAGLAMFGSLGGSGEVADANFRRLSLIRANTSSVARNIMVAGTGDQEALWENGGIFTQALIRGLQGRTAANQDGVIIFDQLAASVRNEVISRAASTGVRQDPAYKVLDSYGPGRVVFVPGSLD